jgi:hypothetical protein
MMQHRGSVSVDDEPARTSLRHKAWMERSIAGGLGTYDKRCQGSSRCKGRRQRDLTQMHHRKYLDLVHI